MPADRIRVLLIDDHAVLRAGLANLLALERDLLVVGEADNGEAGVRLVPQCRPHVAIVDVSMTGIDGVETSKRIRLIAPEVRILMLTSSESAADADESLAAGACGFVVKNAEHDAILAAIRAIHGGARGIRCGVPTTIPTRDEILSPRELEVLRLLRAGHSTTEIARALGITSRTVKFHVAAILEKLGAADRMGAIVKGFDLGLLQPSSR